VLVIDRWPSHAWIARVSWPLLARSKAYGNAIVSNEPQIQDLVDLAPCVATSSGPCAGVKQIRDVYERWARSAKFDVRLPRILVHNVTMSNNHLTDKRFLIGERCPTFDCCSSAAENWWK
jgi:hypothetical protein